MPNARFIHNESTTAREALYRIGYKEGRNRKIIFKTLCKSHRKTQCKTPNSPRLNLYPRFNLGYRLINAWHNFKLTAHFLWASTGWILRQLLARNFRKALGMLRGYFS